MLKKIKGGVAKRDASSARAKQVGVTKDKRAPRVGIGKAPQKEAPRSRSVSVEKVETPGGTTYRVRGVAEKKRLGGATDKRLGVGAQVTIHTASGKGGKVYRTVTRGSRKLDVPGKTLEQFESAISKIMVAARKAAPKPKKPPKPKPEDIEYVDALIDVPLKVR